MIKRCMSVQDRDPFRNPGRSLVKTMVMTTGEFEFDTIFFADTLDFAVVSYILWIIFIILMPVLLTNLLVCCIVLYCLVVAMCVYVCTCVCVCVYVCQYKLLHTCTAVFIHTHRLV